MSGNEKNEIQRTRDVINGSTDFELDAKEGFHRLLDTAEREPSETLRCLCTQWVRHVVETPKAIQKAVDAHAAGCPLKDTPKGKVGVVLQFAKSWPLMIGIAIVLTFSPWVPQILSFAKDVIK